jgi:FO synthase
MSPGFPSAPAGPAADLQRALDQALAGRPLTRSAAHRLMRTTPAELPHLIAAAGTLRDRGKGRTVTYSRKVFIPLTNLCRDSCGYCTFAKGPRHPDARTLEPDDVLGVAQAGAATGCKEALFSLGERPEDRYATYRAQLTRLGYASTNAYLAAMCALVGRETGLIPHANCGVMTRDELLALREVNGSMGLMLESTSERLLERGGAHYNCVGKAPATRLETMALAGELGIAFTTGILIGIGETLEERVDSLFAIRELHQRSGNIQEVIIQNFRVKPTIRMRNWPEPSLTDMLRTIAVARLILGPDMNVQAPPNLLVEDDAGTSVILRPGAEGSHRPDRALEERRSREEILRFAQDDRQGQGGLAAYLEAGINDWGGISPVTLDHINPERAWPAIARLREVTATAGFELRERLCLYPEYLARPEFVREGLRDRMTSWADATGLVKAEATAWS